MSVLRPETPEDRAAQIALVEVIARHASGRALHMPRFSPFDAYLLNRLGEHVLGVIEVKRRTCPSTQYATCPIEVEKVRHLRLAAVPFDEPPEWVMLLGVEWADGVIGTIAAREAERYPRAALTLSKPRDDNDRADPVYHVPVAAFLRLRGPR